MGEHSESTVTLGPDGIIRATVIGEVNEKLTADLMAQTQGYIQTLRAQNKKVLILADQSRAGLPDAAVKRRLRDFFKTVSYDRIAVFGANKEIAQILDYLLGTIGRVLHIRAFKTEEQAVRWLQREQVPLGSRANRMLILAIMALVLAVGLHQFAAPWLLRLPNNFLYQASVVSHDNFYDEQVADYTGIVASNSKFGFRAAGTKNGALDVKNFFDVRTPAGERIFSVERTYAIDPITRMQVPGEGDRNRTGYLFAPSNLHKQDFTYWHVNYDEPARMKFQSEELVLGLPTYRYSADYHADQTNNLKQLPGVGISRGVDLDINLQLWIEPKTGRLIKYEDNTTAYYYDLTTHKRLNPWNQFSNNYSFDSIAEQVQLAQKDMQRKGFYEQTMPGLFIAIGLYGLVRSTMLRRRSKGVRTLLAPTLVKGSAIIAALTGMLVLVGWATDSTLLTRLHPSFSAMHSIVACNFIMLAVALWLSARPGLSAKGKLGIRLLLVAITTLALLAFGNYTLGIDVGIDKLLSALGLPGIDRVSPISSICFVLTSIALWLGVGKVRPITDAIAQGLLVVAMCLAGFAIAGYAFSLQNLYAIGWFHSMAFLSALVFLVLCSGVFAAHQDWYMTKLARTFSRSILLGAAVLLLLLGLTGLSWQQTIASSNQQADIQFQGDANNLQVALSNELAGYIKALQGARGLFAASIDVNRNEWKAYVDGLRLTQNYPGMLGISYAQVVPSSQVAAYTAGIKTQGFPDFAITPKAAKAEYVPVTYIEPFAEQNLPAFGYDLSSDPTRRAALERARDTGEPSMTRRIKLVQDAASDNQYGFLLCLPVYRNGAGVASTEQRRAAIVGYILAPVRMSDFVRATVGERTTGLNISVFDTNDVTKLRVDNRFYTFNSAYDIDSKGSQPKFVRVETMDIGGNTLSLRYASLPNYNAGTAQELPGLILLGGTMLSVLLAALTFLLSSSRNRALKLASGMTEDLRQERNIAITNQHKNEAILSSIGDGVFVLDAHNNIVLFNTAAQLITGFTANEAIGKPYKEVLHFTNDKTGTAVDEFIVTAQAGQKGEMARNTILTRKDGTMLPVADSAAPIVNSLGVTEGAVVVFRDVTRERQLERLKDEFLSVASHELRTPMGAIRANISMILSGDYGPVNKELVEPLTDMRSSAVRLVELVSDLLNVARIEAGRMRFTLSDFSVQELLRETTSSLAPLGKEKGVVISSTPGPSTTIQADPDKVKQVLINLIGNSLKFTDKGSVTVASSLQQGMVEVTVTDTGIGISADDQRKLFGKFKQITTAQDGKPPGTGLGLFISREIIRKMGGELWIKASEPGKGSVFAFTLVCTGTTDAERVKQFVEREAQDHPDQK